MSKEEPYMTFMTNKEIVKHIEHLKTLDLPELEKQSMISDWKKSLNQKEDERLSEGVDIPKPPKPPLSRIIREGTIGDCLKCHSTTIKRFIWFGRKIGCIQPKCENYYYKPKQR